MPLAVEIAGLVAVFAVLIGAWGVLAPSRIADVAIRLSTMAGLWVAAGVRVVFGLALWFAAPASHAPLLLQVLGVITLLAGVTLPFLGVDRFKALIDWAKRLSPTAMRLWCAAAVAVGAIILWALVPVAT